MQKDVPEEDDGFGVPGGKKKPPKAPKKVEKSVSSSFYGKAKLVEYESSVTFDLFQDTMNFQLLLKMTGDACTTKTLNCAPIVHYEKSNCFSLNFIL
jgi:hypothetical protein